MLPLPDEFILPDYGLNQSHGRTIANVPHTVAQLLRIPFDGLPPLPPELWEPLQDVQRVVVLIIDALGQNLIEQHQADLADILEATAVQSHITSVFPSTTVNCLSSLWTGHAPAQHGLIALHLHFPEYDTTGQMIHFTPAYRSHPDSLVDAGLKPEAFLPVPSLARQFATAAVPTYAFKGANIVDSALSKMHGRGVAGNFGAITFAEMMCQMRDLLHQKRGQKLYACGYWHTIDTLSHRHTPAGTAVSAELRALFYQINTILLDGLRADGDNDTAVIILADHGQIAVDHIITLPDDPILQQHLLLHQPGEARIPFFYARQGQQAALIDHLQRTYPNLILPLTAEQLWQSQLLGSPPTNLDIRHRVGDVAALMHGRAVFAPNHKTAEAFRTILKGMHGGLQPDEMRVPWLAFRL